MSEFKPGDKVHYKSKHEDTRIENGIVKATHYKLPGLVFVVYHCDNNWHEYDKYTSELTHDDELHAGWV